MVISRDTFEHLNQVCVELGRPRPYRAPESVPEPPPELTQAFRAVSVLMVDDMSVNLLNYAPYLVQVTGDHASFLRHEEGQDIETLAAAINEAHADVVLMDMNLADGVNGVSLTQKLKERGCSSFVVGFSSDMDAGLAREFKAAGAIGGVLKDLPLESLPKVARLLAPALAA